MKGDDKVIEALNDLLTSELTAINQYYVHYKMCENWGFKRHADKFREESIDEMKHADRIIERILFLDGVPNMQRLHPVMVGENVREQIELSLDTELSSQKALNALVAASQQAGDNGTREMIDDLLVETEETIDWAESQIHLIDTVGLERYLAQSIYG